MVINVPKWASYQDLQFIIEKAISNLKYESTSMTSSKSRKTRKDLSTVFRVLDSSKLRCIFCDADVTNMQSS